MVVVLQAGGRPAVSALILMLLKYFAKLIIFVSDIIRTIHIHHGDHIMMIITTGDKANIDYFQAPTYNAF